MSYVTLGLYVCIRICIKRGDSLAKTNNAKKKRGESRQETRHGVRCAHHTLTEAEVTKSPHVLSERNAAKCEVLAPYTNRSWNHEELASFEWKNAAKCEVCAPHRNGGWSPEEPACFEWKTRQNVRFAHHTLTRLKSRRAHWVACERNVAWCKAQASYRNRGWSHAKASHC